MALRINHKSCRRIDQAIEHYSAGLACARRQAHLERARATLEPHIRAMYVEFARNAHHDYIHHLRCIPEFA